MYLIYATLFLMFCLPNHAVADPLTPFRAEYIGSYNGAPVKARAVRALTATEDGNWRLTSSAKSFLISVSESSAFRLKGNQLVPLAYTYKRTGIGKNRTRTNSFDWAEKTTRYTRAKGRSKSNGSYAISQNTKDKLLYQLQLRVDVKQAMADGDTGRQFTYAVADNNNLEEFRFAITGEERLMTPLGELDTVRLERVRENADRQTLLWLAKEHDYLLVRLKQTEGGGKGFELNLVGM